MASPSPSPDVTCVLRARGPSVPGPSAGHVSLTVRADHLHACPSVIAVLACAMNGIFISGPTTLAGRPAAAHPLKPAKKPSHRGAGMKIREKPGQDWTVALRRQPPRIVDGQPKNGDTSMYEIICCDCGDNPGLDYDEVSPELQRIRGPYPIAAGMEAYVKHADSHPS